MNKLEYFYQNRETFAAIMSAEELVQKEEELLQNEMASGIKEAMQSFLSGVKSPLTIRIDYDPVKGVSVDITKVSDNVNANDAEDADTDEEGDEIGTRSPSVGFSVTFPHGTLVKRYNAKETFVATLRVIGLAKVAAFRGRTFKGFPLVGRESRMPVGKWQKYVDGWYVYTHMSNDTKVDLLRQISDEMKLGLVIRDDDGDIYQSSYTNSSKQKGKRAMFRLNGQGPYNKRQFAYAAVKLYLDKYPNVTYGELEKAFPRELQGSYGVIARMSFIKNKQQNGYDFMGRYYTDEEHLLQTKDGTIFAVCTQWGDQFPNILNNVRRFGWTVSEE